MLKADELKEKETDSIECDKKTCLRLLQEIR
jgi:hypothetical protein